MAMRTNVPDVINDPQGMLSAITEDPSIRFDFEELVDLAMMRYPVSPFEGALQLHQHYCNGASGRKCHGKVHVGASRGTRFGTTCTQPHALPLRTATSPVRPEPAVTGYVRYDCLREFTDAGAAIEYGADTTPIDGALVVVGTAGSMYSTIQDLLRWAKSGTGDSLLQPETVAIRHNRRTLPGSNRDYGAGQYIYSDQPESNDARNGWYGHAGETLAFVSQAFKNDEYDAAVASVVNTCGEGDLFRFAVEDYVKELEGRGAMTPTVSPSTPSGSTGSEGNTESPTKPPTTSAGTESPDSSSAVAFCAISVSALVLLVLPISFVLY